MNYATSLHLGLNRVDPGHYGSELRLGGCHGDARDMQAIAQSRGYRTRLLLDQEATSIVLLEELSRLSGELTAGDNLLLTYAGHGSQVADTTGEEVDGRDETWVLFDRMLLDDELHVALSRFAAGVRVFLISDSCHSGSIARVVAETCRAVRAVDSAAALAELPVLRTPSDPNFGDSVRQEHASVYDLIKRDLPLRPRELVNASVIQLSACRDDQVAADGALNGLFTSNLKRAWADGTFTGNHRDFWREISSRMPAVQTPAYERFGLDSAAFEQQQPFALSTNAQATVLAPIGEWPMTQEQGNWHEVQAELSRRLPNWKPPEVVSAMASPASSVAVIASPASLPSRAVSGPPIVRTFFWGFHIEISRSSLQDFLRVADPVNAIVGAIGPITGPAAPFVIVAAGFVAGALQLLRGLDRGSGVYVSMSWFAPGIFIPTSVPAGRQVPGPSARGPGDPYEQAGDPWVRDYGGGLFGIRLEEDILWNLPDGTVREEVIVNMNPPGFGNIHFNGWLSPDPTVGHFRLHVGMPAFQGGRVNLRMMIRDAPGRHLSRTNDLGPRAITASELALSSTNGHYAST
jgi:metacaspase-1